MAKIVAIIRREFGLKALISIYQQYLCRQTADIGIEEKKNLEMSGSMGLRKKHVHVKVFSHSSSMEIFWHPMGENTPFQIRIFMEYPVIDDSYRIGVE